MKRGTFWAVVKMMTMTGQFAVVCDAILLWRKGIKHNDDSIVKRIMIW